MRMDLREYTDTAALLAALAHPARLCIVRGLLRKQCNVGHMQQCLGISQSSVSQHLAKLKAAGIVEGERCGNEICYRVVSQQAAQVVRALFGEEERDA